MKAPVVDLDSCEDLMKLGRGGTIFPPAPDFPAGALRPPAPAGELAGGRIGMKMGGMEPARRHPRARGRAAGRTTPRGTATIRIHRDESLRRGLERVFPELLARIGGNLHSLPARGDLRRKAIHDVRRDVTRSRALTLLARLPDPVRERVDGDLRALKDVFGPDRDLDVVEQRLRAAIGRRRVEGRDRRTLLASCRSRRGEARSRTARMKRDALAIHRRLARGPAPEFGGRKRVEDALATSLRRVRKAARRALETGASDDLHRLRRRAKTLRHQLEAIEPRLGRPARACIRDLKRLSSILGDGHDATLLRAFVDSSAGLGPESAGRLQEEADRQVDSRTRAATAPSRRLAKLEIRAFLDR